MLNKRTPCTVCLLASLTIAIYYMFFVSSALGYTMSCQSDTIEWDTDLGPLTHKSGTELPLWESPNLSSSGLFTVTFHLSYATFSKAEGEVFALYVRPAPSGSFSVHRFFKSRTETVNEEGDKALMYYYMDEVGGDWQLGGVVPTDGLDVSFTRAYAMNRYYDVANFQFVRNAYFCSSTTVISLSESAWHYIGNAPWEEGPAEDNPHTAFPDSSGPAACSAGGQGLPLASINAANRGLVISDTLFRVESLGPALDLGLTYSPVPSRQGLFGNGWSFSYDSAVTEECSFATVTKGTGQTVTFTGSLCPASPTYPIAATPPAGSFDSLKRYQDRFEYQPKGSPHTYVYGLKSDKRWLLTAVRDKNGNTLTVGRALLDRISSVTDAAGRSATFTYNDQGRCASITVPGPGQATFAYDAAGNLTRVTDVAGVVTTYGYDAGNFLTTMTAGGKTTSFAYDPAGKGNVASMTDAVGRVTRYAPGESANTVTRTAPDNQVTTFSSWYGKTSKVVDAFDRTTETSFGDNGLPAWTLSPGNVATSYEYDARGNITKVIRSSNGLALTTTMTYSGDNMTSLTNPNGTTTTMAYDAADRLIQVVAPTGRTTTYARDAKGQVTGVTTPDNQLWTLGRDAFGNVVSVTDPLGKITRAEYDAAGVNQTAAIDARNFRTAFLHDANRRLTRVTWPDGSYRRVIYDCCAPTTFVDERGGLTVIERDGLLRPTSITGPAGGASVYAYDAGGRLATASNPLTQTYSLTYDILGRLRTMTDPRAGIREYSYTVLDTLSAVSDELGGWTQYSNDYLGRPTGIQYPGRSEIVAVLDSNGQTTRIINARGGTVDYSRDNDGRVTSKAHDGQTVAGYQYDAAGRLIGVTDAWGQTSYTRNARGDVVTIGYPDGTSVSFGYDDAGNISQITYPGGIVAAFSHDGRNRTTSLSCGSIFATLSYDTTGNLTGESRSNGVSSAYTYDAAGRFASASHTRGGNSFIRRTYSRNLAGAVTQETGVQPADPWLADDANAGHYNPDNSLVDFSPEEATTDGDGNVTQITSYRRNLTAAYDTENRMTSLAVDGQSAAFLYDGLGKRIRRTIGSTTRYDHYDHLGRLLFETDATGAVTMLHLYASRRLVASGSGAGNFRFHHMDKTGNLLAQTDASGSVTAAFAYDPFGRGLARTGTAVSPFSFVGSYGVMDHGNDIFFMGPRAYDARTGRFLQKDPIGPAGGNNVYRYADDNPVNRIDPSGLKSDEMLGSADDYKEALQNGLLRDERIDSMIGDAMTSADIALSSNPGTTGKIYSEVKCLFIGARGGGLNKPGVADDVLWELMKMVSGLPGTILDFWDAGNERNTKLALEMQEMFLKKNQYYKDDDKKKKK